MTKRLDIINRKKDILKWIKEGKPKSYICKELKCKQETLNKYLSIMNIEYHGVIGYQKANEIKNNNYIDAITYIKNDRSINSHKLKLKILKDGLKPYKCELCGLKIWLDKPIPLELHHKDGNHFNNNLDNLQILCPNCHALQTNNKTLKIEPKIQKKKEKQCPKCGKLISINSYQCMDCAHKEQYVCEHPSKEELKHMIRTMPFTHIAKKYNVSDKAIVKWCIGYNLPSKKKDIKLISDEDWEKI